MGRDFLNGAAWALGLLLAGCGGGSSSNNKVPKPGSQTATTGGSAAASTAMTASTASPATTAPAPATPVSAGPRLASARWGHAAAALDNDVVVIAGGLDSAGAALASIEVYQAGQFSGGGALAQSSLGHTATAISAPECLIAGGQADAAGTSFHSRTAVYHAGTGQLTPGPNMLAPRSAHLAVTVEWGGQAKVALLGGLTRQPGAPAGPITAVEIFDPAGRRLQLFPIATTEAHIDGAAVAIGPGRLLLVGGYRDAARTLLCGAEILDLNAATVTPVVGLTTPRAGLCLIGLGGDALIAGGVDAQGRELDSLEVFSAATGRIQPAAGRLAVARAAAAAIPLGTQAALLAGGRALTQPRREIDVALASGTQMQSFQLAQARADHTASALSGGRALIVGGRDGRGQALADSEIFDAAAAGIAIATAPPATQGGAGAIQPGALLPGQVLPGSTPPAAPAPVAGAPAAPSPAPAPAPAPAAPAPATGTGSGSGGGLFSSIANWFSNLTKPKLRTIKPQVARPSDLLTLGGDNFEDTNITANEVYIDGQLQRVLTADAWSVVVRAHATLAPGPHAVELIVNGTHAGNGSFDIAGPSDPYLDRIDPSSGRPGEVVTIYGVNFDPSDPKNNRVTFDGYKADVKRATATELDVEVPWSVSFMVDVIVEVGGKRTQALTFSVQ